MTKAEEILEKHLKINDVETMLGRHGATHKAVINALNEAINYTRCCTELKSKKALTFEEWCDVNNVVKVAFNIFMKNDDCLSLGKVSDMYEAEKNL